MKNISSESRKNMEAMLNWNYMSSEEEGEDEEGSRIFIVHRPSYRHRRVNTAYQKMDTEYFAHRSKKSKNQMVKRVEGALSIKKPPKNIPKFAISDEYEADDEEE